MRSSAAPAASASRLRLVLACAVVVIVGVVVAVNSALERLLADGRIIDLGIVDLRLTHNSGVAFGFASGLPAWVVLGATSAIAVGVAIFTWRTVAAMSAVGTVGLVAVMAGAVANIVDRAPDGVVTDYVHTGWFATFNLADSLITCGAIALVWAVWRDESSRDGDASERVEPRPEEMEPVEPAVSAEPSAPWAEPTDMPEPPSATPVGKRAPAGEELERS